MKILALLFGTGFGLSALSQPKDGFRYELEYAGTNKLHITVYYTPLEPDSTVFTYGEPMFGGQPDIINCLSDIITDPPARLVADRPARTFRLYYTGNNPIRMEYEILDTAARKKELRQELFRPMIQENYLFSHGVNLFLNPQFRHPETKATLSIHWTRSPGYPLFYGFDPANGGKTTCISTVDSVLFSLITGAANLTLDEFELQGTKNYIVLRGGPEMEQNRREVRDYYTRFNQAIRRYWNDYSDPCFSLVLQPFLYTDHNVSGVAFSNGFIGKYTADTIVNDQRVYTISHEIGHHWVGHRLEMDIKHQWFGEGFNDYITFLTLYGAGLISSDGFESRMNEVSKAHYGSPVRFTPNDSVFANYWKMGDYNKLPYRRGSLFAFYLDNQIQLFSKQKKSLRNLMLALLAFRNTKPTGYEVSWNDFVREASVFLPKERLEKILDDYITRGNPIPFSDEMLLPVFRVSYENSIPQFHIADEKRFRKLFYY